MNPLGWIVFGYCAWLAANAIFVTPVYTAEGIYLPLMLLAAFVAFAVMRPEDATELFSAGTALLSALVLLGLLQYFLGIWDFDFSVWHLEENPVRAAATFVTPNSFAAAINLFLVPLAGLYVHRGTRRWLALTLWLFAGLVATQSRGGMLSFFAGMGFLALCFGTAVLHAQRRRVLGLLAGCLIVWFVVASAGALKDLLSMGGTVADAWRSGFWTTSSAWLGRGVAERPELYAAAVELIRSHPLAGSGANSFFPLFETMKPASLAMVKYFYVHNDYLQVWLEYGAAGIVLLLALVAAALGAAYRASRREPAAALPMFCGGALAAVFAHSMVDFPLYIPFLLLVVGAYLGTLAAHLGGERRGRIVDLAVRGSAIVTPPVRWALALAALLWLAQPMIAEFALHRSVQLLARGEAQDGIYWQSVARRFEPRHPAHYWAEAMIWRAQAMLTRNSLLAAQADRLFDEGTRVNPYDVANLLGRAELQRRHRQLLAQPAPPAEVLSWVERAALLRPRNLAIQAELVRTLVFVGEREQAQRLARSLLAQYPTSDLLLHLVAEL